MEAEERLRFEIDWCRRCAVCRTLLDYSCQMFPELFRLLDRVEETGDEITSDELRGLIDLCNFCALCPCLQIRAALIQAKTELMDKHGLTFKTKAIENVERIGKVGSSMPKLSNILLQNGLTRGILERAVGFHRDRKFPAFPDEGFDQWMKRRNKNLDPRTSLWRKVAYFAGCTARYLFPEVAKSFVEVFERNGIEVYYPEQQCCGMPCLLEGDRELTLEFAGFNMPHLLEAVEAGYDIVCSCSTCGYMLKHILKEGAYYSPEYLESATSEDGRFLEIPKGGRGVSEEGSFYRVSTIWREALKDEGFFSSLKPADRIKVAERTYDAGEYLRKIHEEGELDAGLGPVEVRAAYYPPCHLREQKIGKPYQDLLDLIPGLSVEAVDGLYCCGIAGVMGFKEEFHPRSIKIGSNLIEKIEEIAPDVIATDCLSCRIQFNQMTSYKVRHPIEIIRDSYENDQAQDAKKTT